MIQEHLLKAETALGDRIITSCKFHPPMSDFRTALPVYSAIING